MTYLEGHCCRSAPTLLASLFIYLSIVMEGVSPAACDVLSLLPVSRPVHNASPPGAATVIRSDADLRNARRKWCSVASTSAIYLGGPLLLTRW
jgi:hypothetical protein